MNRRTFALLGGAAALSACARPPEPVARAATAAAVPPPIPPLPTFYGAVEGEPFPVPAIPEGVLRPHLWRQEVENPWPGRARGTIVIDPDAAMLHFVENAERATRYGVSVGAAGFAWEGTARLQFRRAWPRWKVPETMIERQPHLAPFSVANGGMDPGPDNPMGARALYLFRNGRDTLYRIHGSASAIELGKAVSQGCIRMLNQDVIHLHARAVHGADVVVLPSMRPEGVAPLY
ncbi:L,D-transpeptidase [Jannaschia sp. W003]|uniref:L,D-transpeptidase n=1 Tax=Jannaschia sp. W003 TaxID=2867012 RepID=UPI0021A50B7D|nr:L,D-transpeptidase [Jannaschia sp. W003]UWQ22419.1 L,D-transpeptidase [Jannaschia sp. W003]